MKDYRDCEKLYIGSSDIGAVLLAGIGEDGDLEAKYLDFHEDGWYHAYLTINNEADFDRNEFQEVFKSKAWLKIYDDGHLVRELGYANEITVYYNKKTKETIIHEYREEME